jgi:hypothetical protein
VRACQPDASRYRGQLADPLTPAEPRVLKLLPTSTYVQMADVLCVSRNSGRYPRRRDGRDQLAGQHPGPGSDL